MISTSHEMIRKGSAEELIGHRNRALEYYELGLSWIAKAYQAQVLAAPGSYMPETLCDRYALSFAKYEGNGVPEKMKTVRRQVDSSVWTYLVGATELQSLMDAETLAAFREQVRKEPPEVTLDNLISTLTDLRDRRGSILQQSLVNVFKKLSRHYKNNDAFRLGKKMILDYALSQHGGFYGYKRDLVSDIDRMFHVLDGKQPPTHLNDAGHVVHETSWSLNTPQYQSECESEYFRFKLYRNGNLHVIFKRPDLVAKANKIVADFYGEVLADGRQVA
jgi:hypothetical protein